MIEYYLGEVPILANVETYRLEDAEVCAWVLEHIGELVLKPVDGSGGKGIVIGPAASDAELAELRDKVLADPRGGSRSSRSRCRPHPRTSTAAWGPVTSTSGRSR